MATEGEGKGNDAEPRTYMARREVKVPCNLEIFVDKIAKYEGCSGNTWRYPRWQIKLTSHAEFQDEMAGGFVRFTQGGKGRAIPTPANVLLRGDNGNEMEVYGICHPLYKSQGDDEGFMYMWPCEKKEDYSDALEKQFHDAFPSGTKLTFWTPEVEFHRLESRWACWELESYDKYFELCDFDTVEDFWSYYQQVAKPSQVFLHDQTQNERGPQRGGRTLSKTRLKGDRTVESFCFFRKGIKPESEDPQNSNGGALKLRKDLSPSPYSKYAMDFLWEATVVACIGNALSDDPELICGCRIADKGKKERGKEAYLLEVWLRDSDRPKVDEVKAKLQAYLQDALASAMIPESGTPVFDWKSWSEARW